MTYYHNLMKRYKELGYDIANARSLDQGHNPVNLSYVFLASLKLLASDEQVAKWLPEAESLRMVGCYA
jgi:hypothetical protein